MLRTIEEIAEYKKVILDAKDKQEKSGNQYIKIATPVFDGARNDISSEIENMVEKGYISVAQAESIDKGNASAFFESDLYERMSKAKEVWREKKFMVAVSQLDIENKLMEVLSRSDGMIKGIVDLMFEEEEGEVGEDGFGRQDLPDPGLPQVGNP